MFRRFWALLVVGLILVSVFPGVQAKQYTHEGHHYSLTVPDDWTEQSMHGVDVVFMGSNGANINVVAVSDSTARNDETWLLDQAQIGFDFILGTLNDAVAVQDPRSFTTASSRLAVDYILDCTSMGVPLRMRQVMFVSEYWKMGYVLTFTAERSEFSSHNSVWNEAVDSFTVEGEKSTADGLLLYIVIGAVIGAIAGGVGYAVVRMRRKKKAPSVQEAEEGVEKEEAVGRGTTEEKPEEPKKEEEMKEVEEKKTGAIGEEKKE